MNIPSGTLHTRFIGDQRAFWSSRKLVFDNGKTTIVIPEGFCSDGLSIPKVFQSVFSKSPRYIFAGIIHDWSYKKNVDLGLTRRQCDKLFADWMKLYGVSFLKRRTIYLAVRLGGGFSYKKENAIFMRSGKLQS